jgi:hypothetical protein
MNKKSALFMLACMFILSCSFTGPAMVEREFDRQKMDKYLSLLSENNKAILSIEIVEKGKTTYQNQTGFAYYDSTGQKVKADARETSTSVSIGRMFSVMEGENLKLRILR